MLTRCLPGLVRFEECHILKVDMPILSCIFFTLNWLTLTSEMHFVKFHPKVASCLLSRGKRKYAPLGMRLLWKYIRNYFLVYQLISHFVSYLQNYKEFEAEILDLQLEKYGLSFDIKKCTTSGWTLGDENVIGIRSFKDIRLQIMSGLTKLMLLSKEMVKKMSVKLIGHNIKIWNSKSWTNFQENEELLYSIQTYTELICIWCDSPNLYTPITKCRTALCSVM